uniref:Aminotransferase class I/classII domain-containing protein n=1 Tax=Meloidogyne incognita TaxID=6306 RepID=A0A914KRK9_MELIC
MINSTTNEIVSNDGNLELLNLKNEENNVDIYLEMLKNKFSDPTFLIGLEHFLGNYSIPGGSQLVRESISRHLRRLFGVSLRWEELFLVNNELAALEVFVNTFCLNGDLILCPAPFAYPELAKNIKTQTQIEFWPIPLTTNGKQLEMDDLINTYQKIEGKGRRARALLLHNPHPILGSLQDGDRRIAKLVEWTSEKEMFILLDESLASLNLWEFSSCLALDHNSLQSGKNIIWIWNGSKHFSLPGLEFSVIYYPHQSDIFLNSSIAHYQQCSPLIQFFASKLLDDFEWTSKLFEKRKFRLESLSSQMLNELKNINIYSNQILKTERPITQWILIDLFKYLSLINGNISFVSEKELYKEFKQIGNIELICGEELGMERPGWFRLRYLPNVIERLQNILENKLMTLNNQTEIVDINELGCKYGGGINLFPENEIEEEEKLKKEIWGKIEEEKEVGRKIWDISEGDENEEGLKEREEEMEEDEVLSKVFSIFPEEHWEKQLNNLTKTEIVDVDKLKEKQNFQENSKTLNISQQLPSTDLSFIEELIKSSKREEKEEEIISSKWKYCEEEFYEEAFTEDVENFGKITQSPQTLLISPNKTLEYSPLSVTVPDRPKINFFEKEENYNTTNILDDSNDSKRIIEIIDQIFRDAVQIKDFSSSSTESHPNNAIPQHDRHWSDSGLAAESPPDFSSLSPPPPNKQEKSSTVGIQLPFEELTPEYTRRRLIGPNDQMLDDSGIFVELQPGSLSIDFPLLVPIDKLNKVEEISESILPSKNISSTNLQLNKELINNDNIPIMTINLPFKSVEEEIVGWKPLENLKEENENKELLKPLINEKRKLSATDWYKRFGDEEEDEKEEEEENNKKIILDPSDIAALINEGAEFCPIIKKEQQEKEEERENIKSKSGEVLDWKPLEQINILIEEKKEQEINEEYLVNDNQDSNNIFKESKDSLFNSLSDQLPIISSRKSTKSEALDIVSEWNNKLIKKKVEENFDGNKEEEKVNIDIHLNGDNWQANSKVLILPLTKLEKAEFNIKNNKSIVEQCEDKGHLKTIVHLNSPPKKPQRTSFDSEPEHSNFQKINRGNEEDEKKILFSSNNSSKTQQIHHKMQMRRCRRRPLCGSKLNRNLLTIEHINITQLEYLGGDMLERIEKGERIVTNISTKLNNFAENELFNKLDFQKNERINKFVEIKRNRSEETGKIKTETKIIKRQNNEEIKEENASLYTEIISNNNSENPCFSNKNKTIWRNIPIKQQKISSPSRISITTTQGGILNKNNEGNCVTVKHTPGTNWCVSSIYKTTEYGWEKQTLKPRFATKFDEMPRRTST